MLTFVVSVAITVILLDWLPAIKQISLPLKLPANLRLGHGVGATLFGSTLHDDSTMASETIKLITENNVRVIKDMLKTI